MKESTICCSEMLACKLTELTFPVLCLSLSPFSQCSILHLKYSWKQFRLITLPLPISGLPFPALFSVSSHADFQNRAQALSWLVTSLKLTRPYWEGLLGWLCCKALIIVYFTLKLLSQIILRDQDDLVRLNVVWLIWFEDNTWFMSVLHSQSLKCGTRHLNE